MMEDDLEDFLLETMPASRGRGQRGHKVRSYDKYDDGYEKRRKAQKAQISSFRKAYRGTTVNESQDPGEDRRKHDEKLQGELSECFRDYSRQRLRAVHMSFRQYGNDDSKMTSKEMTQSFQENGVTVPSRVVKSLTAKFDGPGGIDLEALYRFMTDSHAKTGRDSVLAMHKRNDLAPRDVSQEEVDEDLLWRIEYLLIRTQAYIDIPELRKEFQKRDTSKCGKLDSNVVKQVCMELQMPVFGALLKNLIKRCDEEKNEKISWPELISFLEKAQESAWKSCPSLKDIPDNMKTKTPVAPTPLDELSNRARATIVSKLRKKSSMRKSETSDSNKAKNVDENQNNADTKLLQEPKHVDSVSLDIPDETLDNSSIESKSVFEHPAVKSPTVPETLQQQDSKLESRPTSMNETDPPLYNRNDTDLDDFASEKLPSRLGSVDSESTNVHVSDKPVQPETNEHGSNGKPRRKSGIDIRIEHPSEENTPTKTKSTDSAAEVKSIDNGAATPPTNSRAESSSTSKTEAAVKDNRTTTPVETEPENNLETISVSINKGKEATVTVDINGKQLKFTTTEEFLNQQIIDPPKERLKLSWVYGYRGNDCRKNIHVLATGEIVYFMSYVAIIYNNENHKQKHYKEHTDEIKCLDVHSNGITVATGQYSNRKNANIQAHVRVWRSDTLHTLHVLGTGLFQKSVACLSFAPGKDMVAMVDNSLEKKLTVWDTSSGKLMGETNLNTDLACDIGFNSKDPETLVTLGKEHTSWWKVYTESKTIQPTAKPDFEGFLKAKFVICMTYNEKGDLITGDSNGTIYVFGAGGNKITNYIKHAHDGPVFTVMWYKNHILSGGRDGIIHCWQWSRNMDSTGFVQIPKSEGGIRMLCVCENKLLVGTTMNSMLVVNLSETDLPLHEATIEPQPLTQCHYDDLRGLAVAGNATADVLTAGLDGIVCGFNSQQRQPVFKIQYKGNQYMCLDTDCTGSLMVLGTKDGHIQILQAMDGSWQEQMNKKICKDRIDCIKFSPDGTMIVAGSRDCCIYIHTQVRTEDETKWEFLGKLKGHTGAVANLDWSVNRTDDRYLLRSCSANYELKHWFSDKLEDCKKDDIILQYQWTSHSTIVDVAVTGVIAAKSAIEADVISLHVNPSENLVATGDNGGGLSLFRYPCSLNGAYCHGYKSHSTVHCVRFTTCGLYIVSVGGRDSCLMQWELV